LSGTSSLNDSSFGSVTGRAGPAGMNVVETGNAVTVNCRVVAS
jgi:hypothetical protein